MRLFVCVGCGTIFLFKKIDKVVRIFIANGQGNLVNLLVRGKQQVDSGLQPSVVEIFKRRYAKDGGKFMTDPVFAHMVTLFQVIEPERFHKVIIQMMFQFIEIGRTFDFITF